MDIMTAPLTAPDAVGQQPRTVGRYAHLTLALASFGAAVLHFAFSPGHFDEYWAHGTFFVVVGWLQLLWALGMLTVPSKKLLLAGLGLSLGVVAVWVVSRTVGVPIGPDSEVEAVGLPDLLATELELLIAIGTTVLIARPDLPRRALKSATFVPGLATVMGIALVGATTMAVTPAFAGEHHGGGRSKEAAGHNHGGDTTASAPRTAAGAAAPVSHNHSAAAAAGGLTGSTPCEKAGPPASEGQVLDAEGHNHRGPTAQQPIDRATRLQLQKEQETARQVAVRYPTVAAAEKAGYTKSTPYVPCIGAHYTNIGLLAKFDPAAPSELLYDGTTPDARIVGLSYLVLHSGGAPAGFAGPNDQWHQHNTNGGLCLKGLVVVGAEKTTRAECEARGGRKVPLPDIWMVHDWVVPGFECTWGAFASECPELGGRIGGTAWDKNGA